MDEVEADSELDTTASESTPERRVRFKEEQVIEKLPFVGRRPRARTEYDLESLIAGLPPPEDSDSQEESVEALPQRLAPLGPSDAGECADDDLRITAEEGEPPAIEPEEVLASADAASELSSSAATFAEASKKRRVRFREEDLREEPSVVGRRPRAYTVYDLDAWVAGM